MSGEVLLINDAPPPTHTHTHTHTPLPRIYQPPTVIGCILLRVSLPTAFPFFFQVSLAALTLTPFLPPASSSTLLLLWLPSTAFCSYRSIHLTCLVLNLLKFYTRLLAGMAVQWKQIWCVCFGANSPCCQHKMPKLALIAKVCADWPAKLHTQLWNTIVCKLLIISCAGLCFWVFSELCF